VGVEKMKPLTPTETARWRGYRDRILMKPITANPYQNRDLSHEWVKGWMDGELMK